MPFKANQVVTFHYSVKDDAGTLIDSTSKKSPMSFLSGQDQILPKLEEELSQILIKSKKQIMLSAEEAYGPYNVEDLQVISRGDLPDHIELEEGAELLAEIEEGVEVSCFIQKIEGDVVTLDFNHPLAGKILYFDVELLDVRPATAEELSHGHAHDLNDHHHH